MLTPDEVRKLDPNKIILIPERQNPILVDRIVYYRDAHFKAIFDAQKGPLPYPDPLRAELDELKAEVTSLREARIANAPAEAAEKGKTGEAKKQPQEPPLAREVAEEAHKAKAAAERAAVVEEAAAPPAGTTSHVETEPPKRPTLARQVAEELRGGNNIRSDEEVTEIIKQNTKAAKAKMEAFDARLLGKRKAV